MEEPQAGSRCHGEHLAYYSSCIKQSHNYSQSKWEHFSFCISFFLSCSPMAPFQFSLILILFHFFFLFLLLLSSLPTFPQVIAIMAQGLTYHFPSHVCFGTGIWEHNLFPFYSQLKMSWSLIKRWFFKEAWPWTDLILFFNVCILFWTAALISTAQMYTIPPHWLCFQA